ncbi:MAG: hypothetical protein ABIQ09_06015 [Jatrophihabitantaceae bacterium]
MTGLWLLLRARRLGSVGCFVLAVELLVLLYGSFEFRVGQQSVQPVPIAVFAPVLISCALAALCFSPQPGVDRSATRDLKPIVLTLLISCLVLAAVSLAFATHDLTGELTARGACRDLAGFFGLALIGAAFLGAAWFWTLPVLAAIVPMIGLHDGGLVGLLTWPLRSDQSTSATALTLLIAGILGLATARSR